MAERFTEYLRRKADPIWQAAHEHPFVRGIGDGTLPVEKFRYYMRQDYAFLIDFSRVFAYGAAVAPDLATMGKFAELLHATVGIEMGLHRRFAAKFGISEAELEATRPAPTCYAYTRHMLGAAQSGDVGSLAAALLPCMWDYAEIGRMLSARGAPDHPLYAEWIATYASEEFAALSRWLRELLDRLADGAGADPKARWEELFLTSSRYEFMFWDMAYRGEEWPV